MQLTAQLAGIQMSKDKLSLYPILICNATDCTACWNPNKLQYNYHCLFVSILFTSVNNISAMPGQDFLGWTSSKQGLMCLAQGCNIVRLMRIESTTPQSWVKHSITALPNNYHCTLYTLPLKLTVQVTGIQMSNDIIIAVPSIYLQWNWLYN